MYISKYEKIKNSFDHNGCKLLTTKEEIDILSKPASAKYKYIASCGHEHIVYYNVFISRNTGILCPLCISAKNAILSKNRMEKYGKLHCLQLELNCINYFKNIISDCFTAIKAFDGCKADLIIKPKNIIEDKWLGLQFKTCSYPSNGYWFHNSNNYIDCLIICMCWEDKKIWIIPNEDINHLTKISIGLKKSKYDKYEVTMEILINKLLQMYKIIPTHSFDKHDMPICIYQQREKEYYRYRESKINFLKFDYNDMEGLVYDFKIGNKKVQEKIGGKNNTKEYSFSFTMCKNGGNQTQKQYDVGDNDIYWLNCDDYKYFFVIPELIMINLGYIGNIEGLSLKKILKINPIKKNKLTELLQEYLFDYENMDKERLINLFV
jgi:hypothetical protein